MITIFKEQRKKGFIHKSRGKTNPNKKASNIISEIKELYINEYYDYNLEAFYEVIENQYNISYSTMYNEFLKDDIVSPIAHKKTIKLYNEKPLHLLGESIHQLRIIGFSIKNPVNNYFLVILKYLVKHKIFFYYHHTKSALRHFIIGNHNS